LIRCVKCEVADVELKTRFVEPIVATFS